MKAKGSLEIKEIEFTPKFQENIYSSNKQAIFDNVYVDFIRKGLIKHGDVIKKKEDHGWGKHHFYDNFMGKSNHSDKNYIPLIYKEISAGNINGYLEISQSKHKEKPGKLLFFADCNNVRELRTFLREILVCQARRRRGSIAEAEKGIAKILVDKKIEIL